MEQVAPRRGREGSRWINERPTGEDVADWFKAVPLHEGMDHERFVGGITLIPAKEKGNEITGYRDNGSPIVQERENLTFTPYMKVETRVAYFWQLVANHPEWAAVVEPVIRDGGDSLGLPDGYFRFQAHKPDNKIVTFIGYSVRVRVVKREGAEWVQQNGRRILVGEPIFEGTGTKIVSTTTRYDADANSVMKAETGAMGRALGMAGILVLPGSGVATAEDMQELSERPGAVDAQAVVDATAAGQVEREETAPLQDPDGELRARAAALIRQLETDSPEELKAFQEWARGRKFKSLNDLVGPQLKGVVKKLERTLDELPRGDELGDPEREEDVDLAGAES